jgi:hypothetical protein
VARRPESVALEHENLTVIGGDVLAPAVWAARLTGVDAVISALGLGTERMPTTVYSAGTANILTAMARAVFAVSPSFPQHRPDIGSRTAHLSAGYSTPASAAPIWATALLDAIADDRLSHRAMAVAS